MFILDVIFASIVAVVVAYFAGSQKAKRDAKARHDAETYRNRNAAQEARHDVINKAKEIENEINHRSNGERTAVERLRDKWQRD